VLSLYDKNTFIIEGHSRDLGGRERQSIFDDDDNQSLIELPHKHSGYRNSDTEINCSSECVENNNCDCDCKSVNGIYMCVNDN
jgi:hypothetical protein